MAFVYKSEKNLGKEIPLSELGPGQYLPQGIPKKIKPAKAPFNAITFRNSNQKRDEVPGPGSYEYDERFDKFAFMFQDKNKKPQTSLRSLELNANENLDPFTIIINRETQKESAFLTKERRFKEIVKPGDVPGPGFYQKHDPLLLVKNSIKTKKKKEPRFPEKAKLSLMRYEKSPGSPNRVITIPSKNLSYGYDIQSNGEIIMKEDPEKNIKFRGEDNDTVGPGSYDTVRPNQWQKNMVSWEKFSKTSIELKENRLNNSQEFYNPNNSEGNLKGSESLLDVNKGFINDKKDNNKNKQQDNMISTKNELIVAKEKQKEIKDKVLRHLRDKRQKLLDMKKDRAESEDDLLSKNVLHQDPGPGYYNTEMANTAFKKKGILEKYQTFGSSQMRFIDSGINDIGPGSYFKEDQRLEKQKLKKFLDQKVNFSATNSIQKDELRKQRLSDNDQRLGINGLINKQKILADGNVPGPGWYETVSSSFQSKTTSNCGQFGSIQRRFNEIPFSETTPGPGSYLGLTKNQGVTMAGTLHKLMSKNRKPHTDDERSRSPDLRIGSITNVSNIKISKEKDKAPSVGHYNSDILFSMGYKVAKNVNKFNSGSAPFSSVEKRFLNFNKKTAAGTIGPGQYYKDKSKMDRTMNYSSSPPFNTSVDRTNNILGNEMNKTGPGSYNLRSYFDWNKKSYNIQYI